MVSKCQETEFPQDKGWLLATIHKLTPNPKRVREWVSEIKRENPDLTTTQLADYIGDSIVWTYAKQGGTLALPGAIPGLGTIVVQVATDISIISVDIALMVRNQSYLNYGQSPINEYRTRNVELRGAELKGQDIFCYFWAAFNFQFSR